MGPSELAAIKSPAFVIDLAKLADNARILNQVQSASGAKILAALKAFSAWAAFGELRPLLSGVCASGVWEARLGRENFGGEVHTYAPAYSEEDLVECLALSDHVLFNSFAQWERFRALCQAEASKRSVRFGLRINPEHSEVETPLYDPCRVGSRLGATYAEFVEAGATQRLPSGLTGLHFHTLCESGADALERTLDVVERRWGRLLSSLEWVNFGGGHHITRADYDRARLVELVRRFREKYGVDVYMEPGEAVALDAGVLVSTVLDVLPRTTDVAVLDVSATAHMPDVLEMPYRPRVVGSGLPGTLGHTYELAGPTCLAGDVIGQYSFSEPLRAGSRLVFEDMAIYSMVKSTMFNGVKHPSIVLLHPSGEQQIVREFSFEDYKARLS